jgi:hypothetical protein
VQFLRQRIQIVLQPEQTRTRVTSGRVAIDTKETKAISDATTENREACDCNDAEEDGASVSVL